MVHKCLKDQGEAQDHPLAPLVSLWNGWNIKIEVMMWGRRDRSSTQAKAVQQHLQCCAQKGHQLKFKRSCWLFSAAEEFVSSPWGSRWTGCSEAIRKHYGEAGAGGRQMTTTLVRCIPVQWGDGEVLWSKQVLGTVENLAICFSNFFFFFP